jgi:hypothetical protein
MRSFALALMFSASALAASAASDIGFVRVWPAWRTAESFQRISEYFTGKENPGREVIIRTHQESRAGFYYLVRVDNQAALAVHGAFALQIVSPTSAEPKLYRFPIVLAPRQTVFELGLTGSDWPNEMVHPVAWKLELLGTEGQVLASQQSFLWEKPAK